MFCDNLFFPQHWTFIDFFLLFICSVLFFPTGNCVSQSITPLENKLQVHALEDEIVTLSCNYDGDVQNLQWYRQYPGSRHEHVLLTYPSATKNVMRASPLFERLDAKVDVNEKKSGSVDLLCCSIRLCTLLLCPAAHSDRKPSYTVQKVFQSCSINVVVRRGTSFSFFFIPPGYNVHLKWKTNHRLPDYNVILLFHTLASQSVFRGHILEHS